MRLEQPEIGDLIALMREHFNLTRPDLVQRMWDAADAHGVGVDESLIYRWEKGEKGRPRPRPGPHYRRLLGLVCERELSNAEPGARADFLHQLSIITNVPLLRRPTIFDDREPPGPRGIDDMADLTGQYKRMYGTMSPSALRLALAHHLDDLTDLVLRSNSAPVAERARTLAAQAAILAGWLSFETGDRVWAMRYWSLAGEFARDAQNSGLLALALGSRSRIHSSSPGRTDEVGVPTAIRLLDEAIHHAEVAGAPTLLSWLNARKAMLLGQRTDDDSGDEWDDVLDDLIGRP